jgi:hypothetical protein
VTNPNVVAEDEAPYPYGAGGYVYPAYDAEVAVQLAHTGTLMTDGYGNGVPHTITRSGQPDILAGPDTSAAAINPYLRPTINPASLPGGYEAAPAYTNPIY